MTSQPGSKSKTEETASKKASTGASKVNAADKLDLDSLFEALERDLTTVDSEAAQSLIDEWYAPLHKAKEAEIKEIADRLKNLKQLVKGGKATGHEISEVLIEIGEQTSEFASDADTEIKTSLQRLGKQLSRIGLSLGKADDREQIEDIHSLIDTLEGDELTKINLETAQGAIDIWYTILHKSEDQNLQEIANGLKELKQLLKRKTNKSADLAEILTKLGEQTQQSATEAPRGFKGAIQKLGKLLSNAGKSLG